MNINATENVGQVRLKDVEMMNKNRLKQIVLNLFNKKNILIYILAFMLSTVNSAGENMFFGLSIFAAICSNAIPIGMVYIITIIGTFIGFGREKLLLYMITSLVFIVFTLMHKPKYEEERNEKQKLGLFLFLSIMIVNIGKMIFSTFLLYDLLASITTAIESYIFYKIFVNSVAVLEDINIKKAFSIEETMGLTLTVAIAISAIGPLEVVGVEVRSILCILLVLIMGWKNGMLVGATSGITIGTVFGILGGGDPIIIAVYGLSGLLAGLLNRFGKLGVTIGFVIGNTILTFVVSGNTSELIYLKDILIASLGLLLVPKGLQINIKDLINNNPCLPVGEAYRIDGEKEVKEKIDNISETIKNISELYSEDKEIDYKKHKDEFIAMLKANLEDIQENLIIESIIEIGNLIFEDIFEILTEGREIEKADIIKLFEKYNAYILGLSEENSNEEVDENVREAISIINNTYKIYKTDYIASEKVKETKKNISTQLEDVSKVLATMVEELYPQEEYEREKTEIKEIAKKKGITIVDLEIKKEPSQRLIITAYVKKDTKNKKNRVAGLDKIISNTFKEKVIYQKEKDIFEDIESEIITYNYISEDKYNIQIGTAKTTKDGSNASGDSKVNHKLKDGKYLIVLSDGMGSGTKAKKSSQMASKMLDRLLTNGFEKESSIKLINSTISSKELDSTYATLDIAIFDLYKGNIEFVKSGACPTYIKNKSGVNLLKVMSLPAGVVDKVELEVYDKDLEAGDILVMCSDGIMDSKEEYTEKELWLRDLLEKIETTDAQKIADIILKEAIDNNYGKPKDDMTVIVAKITNKL